MKLLSNKPFWIAFRIWAVSVLINTLLGTLYLTDFFIAYHEIPVYLQTGVCFGSLFSFPVFPLLLFVINRCITEKASSLWVFRVVFISGIALTIAVFILFAAFMGGLDGMMYTLLFIAILSAILGIASQCRSLFKLGSDFKKLNNIRL